MNDPEAVKKHILTKDCTDSYKQGLMEAYDKYAKYFKIDWVKTKFRRTDYAITLPTEEQIDNLILEASLRYGAVLSLSKHGLRPIEIAKLGVKHFDLERGIIAVPTAKYGAGRNIKLDSRSLKIIKAYINRSKKYKRFFPNVNAIRQDYARIRKRVTEKLQDPTYFTIRLYDFHHWFGTTTYLKTRDILYVKYMLGHKTLQHTMKYIHLARSIQEFSDEWISKVASNVEEAQKLIEQNFQFVATFQGKLLFRKRK